MYEQYFTDEHKIFRKTVRDFAEKELAPNVDEWEKAGLFPNEVFKRAGELGLFGIRMPEEVGGSGLDYWFTVCYAEELTRCHAAGVTMGLMVQSDMATPIIEKIGTKEQKEEFLTPAIKGEKIAALGVTESHAGSDVAGIKTTAKKDGDDYIINGSKMFITNGTRADFITLAVKTKPEEGYAGVSVFLFPTDIKGFSVGRKLEKLGNWSSDTAELIFEDCRVPKRYLLGEENQGFKYIMMNFQGERLIGAISTIAGSALTLASAIEYAKTRQAFGKPIGKFQVIKHKLVDIATRIEAAKRLNYHCADLYNRGIEATKEISMAKIFAGETSVWTSTEALQIFGGYGYMEEYPVARSFRDTRLITIGGGTTEVMKEIIGKLMGL